jgi:hypothetical protein
MVSGESGERITICPEGLARTAMATVLLAAAIVTLAITSLIQSQQRATAQSPDAIKAAPALIAVPPSVPLVSGPAGPFAFGFLVFDWDPDAPGGVPGFDRWPPESSESSPASRP